MKVGASMGFNGLRVLSLESRRSGEMAKLIANNGGIPTVAPSMREVPIESNAEAIEFARALAAGEVDVVILLTGVGTRALTRVVETVYPRERFVELLSGVPVVPRGPKPIAALREMGVPFALTVPEPNTWREILRVLDENPGVAPVEGRRVAVQEYGVTSPDLLEGLAERGALVRRVPVYTWDLPEDTAPLRAAVAGLAREEFDVIVFTTSVQVPHLLRVAAEMRLEEPVRRALQRILVASVGPATTESLREHGLDADFEPTHPKMGYLVKETAERSAEILARKRA